ncbi:MAG: LacI family DNA-binding transcriptional regulator [Bacteroidales bacterium]|nr:LacI family DNA-binding transcriptional regulator [Bacteroidales bacterium]
MKLLDNKASTPLYRQLTTELIRLVVSGYFQARGEFFTIKEIVKKYKVSPITVRRAIDEMVAGGYLQTSQGKKTSISGTYRHHASMPLKKIAVFFLAKADTHGVEYDEMPWTSTIFLAIQKRLLEKGALWTAIPVINNNDVFAKWTQIHMEYDGFICFLGNTTESILPELKNSGKPYVIIQPQNMDLKYNFISSNDYGASMAVATKSNQKGYKSFLYLGGHFSDPPDKMRGFQETLLKSGIDPQNIYLRAVGSLDAQTSAACFEDFIKTRKDDNLFPLAVCTFGDRIAIGVILTCRKLNLKVPADVGVAGGTGTEEAERNDPPLTTMQIPMREMGCNAVDMIFEMLMTEQHKRLGIKLKTKLIERESL